MTSETVVTTAQSQAGVLARIVVGVVAAAVTYFCSGAAAVLYLSEGLAWLGLLLAVVVVAGAILVTRSSPLAGLVAGGLLGVVMLSFFVTIGIHPSSRPEGGIGGIIVFGRSGL
ncbi:hypothetical protein [Microbacterium candidum]|uniref:Histidinol dehydrogenase n=1 Tax=Microbacterium candidum TaxID=3041922 RepID=A0ABT7MUW3_9MICO|nr:hypothetical protein [Microbacterium sp. ASV49]MDL9978233.1 hypothetical protein [Microbacterium sp. ASV49]